MSPGDEIALFDVVELIASEGDVAAGERGTVIELFEDGAAMVELFTPLDRLDLDRIVVVPIGKLRRVAGA